MTTVTRRGRNGMTGSWASIEPPATFWIGDGCCREKRLLIRNKYPFSLAIFEDRGSGTEYSTDDCAV